MKITLLDQPTSRRAALVYYSTRTPRRYAGLFHPGKFRATAATHVGRISDAATCLVPKASPCGSLSGVQQCHPAHSVPRVELDYLL